MMGLTMEQFLQLPPQEQQRIQMEMQQSQPAPQQGGGMNPAMALQFLPKAGAAASGGGAAAAPVAIGGTSGAGVAGSAAGSAAGGGAAGGGSMLAAAGPWAALAAVIIGNEQQALDKGRRDEDMGSYATDLFSGAVLEQDADHMGDKIGGPLGQATKVVGRLGNPEGLFKTLKKGLKPWEWF